MRSELVELVDWLKWEIPGGQIRSPESKKEF